VCAEKVSKVALQRCRIPSTYIVIGLMHATKHAQELATVVGCLPPSMWPLPAVRVLGRVNRGNDWHANVVGGLTARGRVYRTLHLWAVSVDLVLSKWEIQMWRQYACKKQSSSLYPMFLIPSITGESGLLSSHALKTAIFLWQPQSHGCVPPATTQWGRAGHI
jgi:hypothetical protein